VVAQSPIDSIRVEGVVEPARVATLRAAVGGLLDAVAVTEGDAVTAGATLLAVDATDAELAVARAAAAVAQAEAQLAQVRDGTLPEQVTLVAAQVDVAEAAVAQAVAQRDAVTAGLAEADVLRTQAALRNAQLAHDQAVEAHDDTMKCYNVPTPDGGEQDICPTLGTLEEMARAQMEAAYAGIVAAQAQLDQVQAGVAPEAAAAQAEVLAAVAQRDATQAQLALAEAGARREAIAVAEAGVEQTKVALAQAQELLTQHTTTAPFTGTVTDLPVAEGGAVAVGEPLATIATLDRLQVRTTDLTELDIAQVQVGQAVLVTLDAAPNQPLTGSVVRLDPQGMPSFGDVIYDAVIALDDAPAWLRWGMTAQVDIGDAAHSADEGRQAQQTLIVEGAVAPEHSVDMRFVAGGEVAEVFAEVGDVVAAGDVIARLDDGHQRLGVMAAKAALSSAQAELALIESEARTEQVMAAEADIAAAKAGLQQAVAARDQLRAGVAEAEIAGVRAELEQARAQRRQLEAALLWAEGDDDDERAADVRDQMQAVDLAISGYEARLATLPVASTARLNGADAGVAAALAQVAVAQAALDVVQAGPTGAAVRVAEAEIEQAEVDLREAEVLLARTQLLAPFSGTVTQVSVEVGETVAAGQPVAVLADLAHLRVETTDLTELDVTAVQEGQTVRLTVDALPGESWQGQVRRIKHQPVIVSDDVTYPTLIDLDEPIPNLRWGMTVAVTIGE
jgi:multidrug resistance efflux pump